VASHRDLSGKDGAAVACLGVVAICAIFLCFLALGSIVPFRIVVVAALTLAAAWAGAIAILLQSSGDRSGGVSVGGLSEQEVQIWRRLIGAVPSPALLLDGTGQILYFNDPAQDLFPRLRKGAMLPAVIRAPELIEAVARAPSVAGPQVVGLVERVPVERHLQATVAPVGGTTGTTPAQASFVMLRDLTEQGRLDQMRRDFVANASHELRTPLASIRGFVETLQGPARDDSAARDRFLAIMASEATRMTRLIDDLLSLSRIEMRLHVPPRGTVDLNEVAAQVAQALEPVARGTGVALHLACVPGTAAIRGERDEIVQAASNLLQNAIKYGKRGGRVDILVRRETASGQAPRVVLAVKDDGPGIAPQHLPRLTERFYRVNTAASRETGGTGLGLAIVKHVVMRHRGELSIESSLGEGSTFELSFLELAGDMSETGLSASAADETVTQL